VLESGWLEILLALQKMAGKNARNRSRNH